MINKRMFNVIGLLVFIIFLFGCAQRSEEKPTSERAEEFVDTGILAIESFPSSAEVYVDGELKGATPFTLYNFPAGTHDVLVRKEGYTDFERVVTIKVGRTEEIEAILAPLETAASEIKPIGQKKIEEEALKQENAPVPSTLKKINLSSFAMYHDFDKAESGKIRTSGSDIFSRKYSAYVDLNALVPAFIKIINKPIGEVTKEDCSGADKRFGQLYSGQTLCVKTTEGVIIALAGSWTEAPAELGWKSFD